MKIILHRRNTLEELHDTDKEYGVEVDVRSNNNELIIHHDPLTDDKELTLKQWLKVYKHDTLIVNIKEEGLEKYILQLLEEFNIEDFFFLDQSFPFLIIKKNLVKCKTALRFSEYESFDTIKKSISFANWVWIDCFTQYPSIDTIQLEFLRKHKVKLCLVSPELQGHSLESFVHDHKSLISKYKIDAVCTKHPEFWKNFS